ncbi:hypothetical protein LCGC14_3057000 [marine sediment metagenome]|uniref:DUF6948 domain-containing protein n=1 Tax=marine sediment metagenome TaxID=412755 RepID=A0A0F8ZAS7_9ZZZZ
MKKEVKIDGITYVLKDSLEKAEKLDGMDYVLVRTYSAGVHFGYLEKRDGKEVTLRKSRRIWYWKGACSVSQIAVDGVTAPDECKIAIEVDSITLIEAIEIIPITEKAKINLQNVQIWKQ